MTKYGTDLSQVRTSLRGEGHVFSPYPASRYASFTAYNSSRRRLRGLPAFTVLVPEAAMDEHDGVVPLEHIPPALFQSTGRSIRRASEIRPAARYRRTTYAGIIAADK
jgi:hypothetical protein